MVRLRMLAEQILEQGPGNQNHYVVVGGGLVGCETAEYLAEKGKKVAIVEILPEIGAEYEPNTRSLLLQRLAKNKVMLLEKTEITGATEGYVQTRNLDSGEESSIPAQILVIAVGADPNRELYDDIQSLPCESYVIGDARKARGIPDAIFEATKLAYKL